MTSAKIRLYPLPLRILCKPLKNQVISIFLPIDRQHKVLTRISVAEWSSDLKSGDPALSTSWICSRFNSSAVLVHSQLVCFLPVGFLKLLSLFELLAGPHQPLGCHNPTCLAKKYMYVIGDDVEFLVSGGV